MGMNLNLNLRIVGIILLAHFTGDYLLQQDPMFMLKRVDIYILLLHTVIWSVVIGLALLWIKRFAWWKLLFSFIIHTAIDYWKLHFNPYPTPYSILALDQLLHALQLYVVGRSESRK